MSGATSSNAKKSGFAGLSAMASTLPAETAAPTTAPAQANPVPQPAATHATAQPAFEQPGFWTSGRKWAAVAVGAIGLITVVNMSQKTTQTRAPSSTVATSPGGYAPSQPSTYPSPPSKPAPTSKPAVETVSRPSGAPGQTLSTAELRYCLTEKIRLDRMEMLTDNRISAHVRNYNALVGDFNTRCGTYRYRQRDLDSARTSVEAQRSIIEAQAAEQIRNWR
ncbi:hypothetical protein [Microvirga zambiensis]|uniref:hypothetical protein n=1 Tax=Microvirga zambiensis TaxID=1402137 RepID=UPI00191F0837|nr:hypothetical protein [Microvirga zambiensis]